MKKLIILCLILNVFFLNAQEFTIIDGRPPETYRAPVYHADPSKGDVILQNVPTYRWSHGCAATSAAMLI